MENVPAIPSVLAPAASPKPVASLVLGIISLFAWLLPIIGFPVAITGIVFGAKALRSHKPAAAGAGLALSIVGAFATTVNAAIGAYMGVTGQLHLFR